MKNDNTFSERARNLKQKGLSVSEIVKNLKDENIKTLQGNIANYSNVYTAVKKLKKSANKKQMKSIETRIPMSIAVPNSDKICVLIGSPDSIQKIVQGFLEVA